ncbi:MAG: anthranilate synthase component I [Pseudomonadales bacterium]
MKPQQFAELADAGYNRIPLVHEIVADLETPLSCYLKLADGAYSFLFESVQGGETWGRYSIIGLPANTVLSVHGDTVSVHVNGELSETETHCHALAFVEAFRLRYKVPDLPELPGFHGGLVGYFGHETVRLIEPRLRGHTPPAKLGVADILLLLTDELVVFDNLSGTLKLIVHADPAIPNSYEKALQRLNELENHLRQQRVSVNTLPLADAALQDTNETHFESDFKQRDYEHGVRRIKDYVLAGDTMQTVLSQRLSTDFSSEPIDFYRALRLLNPSPYLYFLNLADFHIVGSSPEILVRAEKGLVTVRPIAGTRPRGQTEADDLALENELLADPKELAEHLMLIDLGRNDIGRIAATGSVELTDKMIIERYSHVMHIVSNVTAKLRAGMTAMDVLRATFPAGTLSGAPKIRALEIIDELEPIKREIYGGAVGYISWQGNMDTAIAIRTAVIKDEKLYIQAGAGIVADSIPEQEWQETLNKARAIFRAAALAKQAQEP